MRCFANFWWGLMEYLNNRQQSKFRKDMPKYSEEAHSEKKLSTLKQKASSERVAALNEHIASIYPQQGNHLPIRRWGNRVPKCPWAGLSTWFPFDMFIYISYIRIWKQYKMRACVKEKALGRTSLRWKRRPLNWPCLCFSITVPCWDHQRMVGTRTPVHVNTFCVTTNQMTQRRNSEHSTHIWSLPYFRRQKCYF